MFNVSFEPRSPPIQGDYAMRMTSVTVGVLMTGFVAAGCSTTPVPATADRHPYRYTIEEFLDTTSMSGASFSPDEQKILVSSDKSGVFNAYAVAVTDGRQTRIAGLIDLCQDKDGNTAVNRPFIEAAYVTLL